MWAQNLKENNLPGSGFTAFVGIVLVIALGILLRSEHMTDVLSRSPDERTYMAYATRLVENGVEGYRLLFRQYNADSAEWAYPAPSRFGYVFLAAVVMKVSGVRGSPAGAAVSWSFSILSMILLTWIGIRYFNRWIAFFSVAFMAFSFGELGMARRAWQDATFGFIGLLLVYLTCEIVREPARRMPYVAFFAIGTYSMLIKETAYFTYGCCWFWLAAFALGQSSRRIAVLVLGGLSSIAAALIVWSVVAGNPKTAIESAIHLIQQAGLNPYAAQAYSGPWQQFFRLLWVAGPLTSVMALTGTVVAILSIRDYPSAAISASVTMLFLALAAFGPQLQNLRIISPSNGTYFLMAGIGLWFMASRAGKLFRNSFAALTLVLICLAAEGTRNYRVFDRIVVQSAMEDLAVRDILNEAHGNRR